MNAMEKTKHVHDRRERGWTFIETLIVIGIIVILASSVGIIGFRYLDRARVASAKNQIEVFAIALEAYQFDCGVYPSEAQGIDSLWEKPTLEPVPRGWDGPYISKQVNSDPWGTSYEYQVPGPNKLPFGITSLGSDGEIGGDGVRADLRSWEL